MIRLSGQLYAKSGSHRDVFRRAPYVEIPSLANYRSHVALSAGVIAVSAVTVYMVLFMPTFAIKQLHLSPSVAFLGSLLAGTIHVVLIPIVGHLSDRHDRISLSIVASLAVLILAYPLFAFLVSVPSVRALLAVQGVLGVLNAINLGCLGALVAGLFPTRMRTSGLSFAKRAHANGDWRDHTLHQPVADRSHSAGDDHFRRTLPRSQPLSLW
jgi:MFS transporter, MHS family, proline/betaine transporter